MIADAAPVPTKYEEVDSITDSAGVVAPITRKDRQGRPAFSAAIMREFPRNGRMEKTAYFNRDHIAAIRRVLDKLEARFDELETEFPGSTKSPVVRR
jgi:hypothetical protein